MPIYSISKLKDKAAIRAFLERDAGYAAYALGDLEPPYEQHAKWYGARRNGGLEGLALVYGNLEPPGFFLMGSDHAISAMLMHSVGPDKVYFTARPEQRPILETWYSLVKPTAMFRMRLASDNFRPSGEDKFPIVKLDPTKIDETNAFYKLGEEAGEEIVAFTADQVRDGFFFGIYLEEKLIAAAGTHLVAKQAKLAAVGNVLTHPEYRGKGLGKATSNAVVSALFEAGMETILLNVAQDNQPALAIYKALGFEQVGPFIEGQAKRR